jgi:hypothetical protein
VDIIALLPFDYVIVEAIWPPCYVSNTARYVSLLKLLRLVRNLLHLATTAPLSLQTLQRLCLKRCWGSEWTGGVYPLEDLITLTFALQLRMYRVLLFFRVLEYNLVVSLFTTTMVRNFVYIIYTAHWAGALPTQPHCSFCLLLCGQTTTLSCTDLD